MPLVMLIVLAIVSCGMLVAKSNNARLAQQRRERARYYYMEGSRYESMDSIARAYELYKKAYLEDSTYEEAGKAFGFMRFNNSNLALLSDKEVDKSLGMIKKFVDTYPGEYYEGSFYAYLCVLNDKAPEAIRVFKNLYKQYPQRTNILLLLADSYGRLEEPDSAIECFNLYEQTEGRTFETSVKKMGIYLDRNDTLSAVNEIDQLVKENPKEGEYVILKGKLYQMLEKPDSAYKYFRQAEELYPEQGNVKIGLAQYYRDSGDSVQYDNKMYEALLSEDLEMEQKLEIVAEYLQKLINDKQNTGRGDYLFSVLRNQYPHEPEVLDLSARYNAAKGNYEQAIEDIGYAIDMVPDNMEMPAQKMSYQISNEQYEDAMQTYVNYYSKEDRVADNVKILYASAATQAGRYEESDSVFRSLLEKLMPGVVIGDTVSYDQARRHIGYDETNLVSIYLLMMGDNYYQAKDLDNAFKCYDDALYFNPDNIMALNNYAYFLVENGGDLEKAEKMSKKTIDTDGDNDTYLDTYAWILYKLGRPEDALVYQQAAMEKVQEHGEKPSADLYDHLGDILQSLGRSDEAQEMWIKASEAEPENNDLKAKAKIKSKVKTNKKTTKRKK